MKFSKLAKQFFLKSLDDNLCLFVCFYLLYFKLRVDISYYYYLFILIYSFNGVGILSGKRTLACSARARFRPSCRDFSAYFQQGKDVHLLADLGFCFCFCQLKIADSMSIKTCLLQIHWFTLLLVHSLTKTSKSVFRFKLCSSLMYRILASLNCSQFFRNQVRRY